MAGVNDAAPKAAYALVFCGSAFIYFYVIPALDRITTQMEALRHNLRALNEEMNKQNEHEALNSMGSQIEVRDEVGEFFKGQRIQASGISLFLDAHTCIEFQRLSYLLGD